MNVPVSILFITIYIDLNFRLRASDEFSFFPSEFDSQCIPVLATKGINRMTREIEGEIETEKRSAKRLTSI